MCWFGDCGGVLQQQHVHRRILEQGVRVVVHRWFVHVDANRSRRRWFEIASTIHLSETLSLIVVCVRSLTPFDTFTFTVFIQTKYSKYFSQHFSQVYSSSASAATPTSNRRTTSVRAASFGCCTLMSVLTGVDDDSVRVLPLIVVDTTRRQPKISSAM